MHVFWNLIIWRHLSPTSPHPWRSPWSASRHNTERFWFLYRHRAWPSGPSPEWSEVDWCWETWSCEHRHRRAEKDNGQRCEGSDWSNINQNHLDHLNAGRTHTAKQDTRSNIWPWRLKWLTTLNKQSQRLLLNLSCDTSILNTKHQLCLSLAFFS